MEATTMGCSIGFRIIYMEFRVCGLGLGFGGLGV